MIPLPPQNLRHVYWLELDGPLTPDQYFKIELAYTRLRCEHGYQVMEHYYRVVA